MALTITQPDTGAAMGYGCRMRCHSTTITENGEHLVADLYYLDGLGVTRYLARARGSFSLGSGQADIIWGRDVAFGGFMEPLFWGPSGLALGANVSVYLQQFDALAGFVEDARFADIFVHDPVSQFPSLLYSETLHDPMLDDILAAVYRTFPMP